MVSQARLPRTEPSTELITAHKGNNCDAHAALQTRDFSALPKHRAQPHFALKVRQLDGYPVRAQSAAPGCRHQITCGQITPGAQITTTGSPKSVRSPLGTSGSRPSALAHRP